MTIHEFDINMQRLKNNYGNSFNDEKIKMIYSSVKEFPVVWWAKTVDWFIASSRTAPLVQDIRDKAADERERLYYIEKKKNAEEAERFMCEGLSKYADEDKTAICRMIISRMQGCVSDSEWDPFVKGLEETAKNG